MLPTARTIHTVEGIRTLEAPHLEHATPSLMERAGAAAAELALELLRGSPGGVLVACGPGNNGGDGLVLARLLKAHGLPVEVVLRGEPDHLPRDAARAFEAWQATGGGCLAELPPGAGPYGLVVDALFGIGLSRPLDDDAAALIARLNALEAPRLALDLPSGLHAGTGAVLGTAFRASHTISFIGLKPGLLTAEGPDHCGRVRVATLDIDSAAGPGCGRELAPSLFSEQLRPRRLNSHKGSYGDVVVIGGARGMVGAALLAGRAALMIGAGRVFVGLLDRSVPAIDAGHPELMVRSAGQLAQAPAALAVGPGLGRSVEASQALTRALEGHEPLVLDADALNLIAEDAELSARLVAREAPAVLTPHPAEAARLLGCSTGEIQADRIAATHELATRFGCPALLKGCGSVIATPTGEWFINTTGNPGMASAGMGDTLSGLIAGLLAQSWPAAQALKAAVHLHGAAADQLARQGIGPIGLTAGETAAAARQLFNQWIQASARA